MMLDMTLHSTTLDQLPPVLDSAQAAIIQRCSPKTVEEMLRAGALPGEKWGEGWAIPTRAYIERLNEIAVEKMMQRRDAISAPSKPQLVSVGGQRTGRKPPALG